MTFAYFTLGRSCRVARRGDCARALTGVSAAWGGARRVYELPAARGNGRRA